MCVSQYTLQLEKYAVIVAYHVLFQIRTFVVNQILSRISAFLLRFYSEFWAKIVPGIMQFASAILIGVLITYQKGIHLDRVLVHANISPSMVGHQTSWILILFVFRLLWWYHGITIWILWKQKLAVLSDCIYEKDKESTKQISSDQVPSCRRLMCRWNLCHPR